MKCTLHNLGCKVNSYETEAMRQLLEAAGYDIVEFGKESADVYIINTCTVTNIADRKSRQMLHKAKKDNPNAVVVAAGCYVQEAGEKLLEDSAVDIIVGNNKKGQIVEVLDEYFKGKDTDSFIDINKTKEYERLAISGSEIHTRAYIKIQDGCNQFCTYCIIPFARGRVRSRSLEDIMSEVNKLAESGCHEIVITGIHLSSYGLDFDNTEYNAQPVPNAERLLQVIEAIDKVDGIERIRLGSLEPRIITDAFLTRLSAVKKICPHFHLSLQSGCDATLRRMNRRYDTEEFSDGVDKIRKYFDRPAITTDVIVGFPGETDEEFAVTKKYLEKIKFFEMHVFKYSRRKGTIADRMENQVADSIKSARSDELIELDDGLSENYRESFVGEKEKVLVEEYVEKDGKKYAVGHTRRYVKVYIPVQGINDGNAEINSEVDVIIDGLFGKDSVMSQVAIANF
ncbi:tRNA-I(6)A37 thiotransferase enzyme MiaB [Firmicutes bacterium CAG:882]|nr:tRNA-I(6)A37 thiotransferase enzyme MiaB [Firmicutes bacterium CAG:882]